MCSMTPELESTQGSAAAMFPVLSWGALTLAFVVVLNGWLWLLPTPAAKARRADRGKSLNLGLSVSFYS